MRDRFDATAASEHTGRHRRMYVSSCVYQCPLRCFRVAGLYIDSIPPSPVNAQVISDASNAAAAALLDEPPQIGNRSPGIWSVCFQGGTFDRVKQRCRLIAACHICIDHIVCLFCIMHLCNQLSHCMYTMSRSDTSQVLRRLQSVPADEVLHVAARATAEVHRQSVTRPHRCRASGCGTTRHARPN